MSLRPQLRELHRTVLVGLAQDITSDSAGRSALVLAPHPDDETIACGATIARKVAHGSRVHVVIATESKDVRRRDECAEACRRLGLMPDALQFLGFPDGALQTHSRELDAAVREVGERFHPDELIAPLAVDAHPDHRALAASAERLRDSELRDVNVLSYPVWFWNRWAWVDRAASRRTQRVELVWRPLAATFSLQPRVVHTGGFLAHKRNALSAHATQTLDPTWLSLFLGPEELFFEARRR